MKNIFLIVFLERLLDWSFVLNLKDQSYLILPTIENLRGWKYAELGIFGGGRGFCYPMREGWSLNFGLGRCEDSFWLIYRRLERCWGWLCRVVCRRDFWKGQLDEEEGTFWIPDLEVGAVLIGIGIHLNKTLILSILRKNINCSSITDFACALSFLLFSSLAFEPGFFPTL